MWRLMLLGLSIVAAVSCLELSVQYSWKELDYNFPNESMRREYVASGDFVQKNNLPLGISFWRDKMFVTMTRWKNGVPANLNYVTNSDGSREKGNISPKLTPYPSFEANDVHSDSDDVIVSMYRSRVDACDRLWGLDMGVDDIVGTAKSVRPIRLVVIDLKTNKIIRTYELKDSDKTPDSVFVDLIVDADEDSCDDAFAYVSDPTGYGLVVYSWARNDSWRFKHHYLYLDPLYGDYNISGINLQFDDGIFGLTLSPRRTDGSKTLYFQPLSGTRVFSVPTSVLKNQRNVAANNYHMFRLEGNKGHMTQGTSIVMDLDTEIIYFNLANQHAIACWNTKVPLNPATFKFITGHDEKLAFMPDMNIDPATRKLYVLMSNLPKLLNNKVDPDNRYVVYSVPLDGLTDYCRGRAQSYYATVYYNN